MVAVIQEAIEIRKRRKGEKGERRKRKKKKKKNKAQPVLLEDKYITISYTNSTEIKVSLCSRCSVFT